MKNREKRLGISEGWYSRSGSYTDLESDKFIRKLVRNIYLKHGILTSEAYIHRYPERISIKFLMYITDSSQYKIQNLLISLIKSILVLKYNKNVNISYKQCSHLMFNSKILVDYLEKKLKGNPNKVRMVLKNVISKVNTDLSK